MAQPYRSKPRHIKKLYRYNMTVEGDEEGIHWMSVTADSWDKAYNEVRKATKKIRDWRKGNRGITVKYRAGVGHYPQIRIITVHLKDGTDLDYRITRWEDIHANTITRKI